MSLSYKAAYFVHSTAGGWRWGVESEPSIPFLTLWSLSFPMCKIMISVSCIEMCQD